MLQLACLAEPMGKSAAKTGAKGKLVFQNHTRIVLDVPPGEAVTPQKVAEQRKDATLKARACPRSPS